MADSEEESSWLQSWNAAEHEKLDLKRQPFTSLEDDEEADVFDERQEAYGTECLIHKLLCFVTA